MTKLAIIGVGLGLLCAAPVQSAVVDLSGQLDGAVRTFITNQCLGDVIIERGDGAADTLQVDTNTDLEVTVESKNGQTILRTVGAVRGAGFYFRAHLKLGASNDGLLAAQVNSAANIYLDGAATSSDSLALTLQGSGVIAVTTLVTNTSSISASVPGSGEIFLQDLGASAAAKFSATVTGSGSINVAAASGASPSGSIDMSGSGDVCVGGASLSFDKLAISMSGSGDIWTAIQSQSALSGEVDVSMIGAGDIDVCSLRATTVNAQVPGSGDIWVSASDSITGSISGSGTVYYVKAEDSLTVGVATPGSGETNQITSCPSIESCERVPSAPATPTLTNARFEASCNKSDAPRLAGSFALVAAMTLAASAFAVL